MDSEKTKTLGESRVRASFNPSGDSTVDMIKKGAAELIDLLESTRSVDSDMRLIAVAQTAIEEACMWAVKAVTA